MTGSAQQDEDPDVQQPRRELVEDDLIASETAGHQIMHDLALLLVGDHSAKERGHEDQDCDELHADEPDKRRECKFGVILDARHPAPHRRAQRSDWKLSQITRRRTSP